MKTFSFIFSALCAMLFFACQTSEELAQPSLINSEQMHSDTIDLDNPDPSLPFDIVQMGDRIQNRMPLYETRGTIAISPLDFCRVTIDAIRFSNGQTVSFNSVIIQNNTVDPIACQALVEAIQAQLFEFYGVCYTAQLHASVTGIAPPRTMQWFLCIGDIASGSIVEDVTYTIVSGPCNAPSPSTITLPFFENMECAPFEHQYVSTGCELPVFERISWGVVAGYGSVYWTDMRVKRITTSDGTVYNMDVPLLAGGLEIFGADFTLAQIFQQSAFNSYGICYDSRAEFLVQEQAFVVYLGLGDISPASTVLDSWRFWVRASNGVEYYMQSNIGENGQPGQFVVLDQTCP